MINQLIGELYWAELSDRVKEMFGQRETIRLHRTSWGNQMFSFHTFLSLLIGKASVEMTRGTAYRQEELFTHVNENLYRLKNSMLFHLESMLGQDDKPCKLDSEDNLEVIFLYWSRAYDLYNQYKDDDKATEALQVICQELYD